MAAAVFACGALLLFPQIKDTRPVLRVAIETSNPPIAFENETGEPAGLDIDIIHAVAREMDYRVSFRATAFSLLFSAVENDLADIAIGELTITEQRKKTVDFTNSYHQSSLALLVRPDNTAQNLGDLKGKSIGVKNRSTGDFYLENLPGYTIRRLSIFPDLAQLLSEKVIDGIVFDRLVIEQWVARHNIAGRIITLEGQEEYAIAYQKKNPDLGRKLNKAIDTLAKSGKLDVIIKKWLTPYSEGNTAPSLKD